MTSGGTAAAPVQTAAEIAQLADLSREARALLEPDASPAAYLQRLLRQELWTDAIRLVAHVLPKREAVWWGCLCVWQVVRPDPPAEASAALEAVVRWVREPDEANRRTVEKLGQAAGVQTPAGCVAMAAVWSGGSMAPPNLPAVPPPPNLTAKTVAAAVLLAVARGKTVEQAGLARQFIQVAQDVARGANRWE